MAGDWIKMELATPEKPEVMAIAAEMGWDDPDLAVGKLFKLWRWFDQHTESGNAASVTPALLNRIIGVTGFAEACESVGWLEATEDGLALPNFDRHNGNTAKRRCQTAKRASALRGRDKSNAASVTNCAPREEKRREEKKQDNGGEAKFDEFWQAYPRKSGIARTRRLWALMGLDDKAAEVMAGLARCKASAQWSKDNGAYIPGIAKWLEGEGWHDQPDPSPARKLDPLAGKPKAELDGLYAMACEKWPDCKAQGRGSDYTRSRMAKLARGAA